MSRLLVVTGAAAWALVVWRYTADACRYAIARWSYQTEEKA